MAWLKERGILNLNIKVDAKGKACWLRLVFKADLLKFSYIKKIYNIKIKNNVLQKERCVLVLWRRDITSGPVVGWPGKSVAHL